MNSSRIIEFSSMSSLLLCIIIFLKGDKMKHIYSNAGKLNAKLLFEVQLDCSLYIHSCVYIL